MPRHSQFSNYPPPLSEEAQRYTARSSAASALVVLAALAVLALVMGVLPLFNQNPSPPTNIPLGQSRFPSQEFSSIQESRRVKGWKLSLGTLVDISEPYAPEDGGNVLLVRRYTLFSGTWEEWERLEGQDTPLETFFLPFDLEAEENTGAEVGEPYAVLTVPLTWGKPPFVGLSGPYWHNERTLINSSQGLLRMAVEPDAANLAESATVADTEAARSLGVSGLSWEELQEAAYAQ